MLTEAKRSALMALLSNDKGDDKNNMASVIQVLLDAGAEVNSPPSATHSSALQAAIDTGHEKFVDQLLARGADVNANDPRFGTALSAASRRGSLETMKKLIDKGADITSPGDKYGSPLQAAAQFHRIPQIAHLLSLGADVNQISGRTGYALHAAACYDSIEGPLVMKMLLDAGAPIPTPVAASTKPHSRPRRSTDLWTMSSSCLRTAQIR